MKDGVIILSGYNMRAIIAFIRVCENNNIPFYIIANNQADSILLTKYKVNVSYIRKDNDIEKLFDIIINIKNSEKLDTLYVIPSTEYLNRYLLNNKDKYSLNNIKIPLVDKKLYELVSDKLPFAEMCRNNNFNVPHIYENFNDIKFPVILKPTSYFKYIGKPKKINNYKELNAFIDENNINDWFIQQYLYGSSYYLLYYINKNGDAISYSQRNFIQQENGASIVLAKSSSIHEMPISKKYINMLKDNKFYGLIMIELRKSENEFYMIEANPRLWGPSQLFVDSKVPIFENFLHDMGFYIDSNILKNREYIDSIYFWNEGIILSDGMETYYDFDKESVINSYDLLIKSEIYNRDDTIKLFCQKRAYNVK